ncbi:MAG: hypothetical protein AAF433_06930 [Bacteroidota bacterium]
MLRKSIAIVLFITGVGTLMGQYPEAPPFAYYNVAAVNQTGIYTDADSIHLDYRIDSLGAQFLVLSNFTDSTILYAGDPAGLITYRVTALNPKGEWISERPSYSGFLCGNGGSFCGTGYGDYSLPTMHQTWILLPQITTGSFTTRAKFIVMVQGQEYATRDFGASINPDFFLSGSFKTNSIEQSNTCFQHSTALLARRIGRGSALIEHGFLPYTLEEITSICHVLDPNESDFYTDARRLHYIVIFSIQHKTSVAEEDRLEYSAANFAFMRATNDGQDHNGASELYNRLQNLYVENMEFHELADEVERDPLKYLRETMIPMYQKYVLAEQ